MLSSTAEMVNPDDSSTGVVKPDVECTRIRNPNVSTRRPRSARRQRPKSPNQDLQSLTIKVVDNICKFANNGLTPSKSGIVLPDSHEIAQVNRVTGSKTVKEPSLNKKNMIYKFRFKNRFLQKGRISKKRITVKRHGIASDTPNDLHESIHKKRKTMEGQGLESEMPKELYEPISKKRKTEIHGIPSEVPKDFNVFIPKKKRTVKGRGLASKEPKDLYELVNGYPSEIPKDLYENAVKGLGLASDIPERIYMLVKKAVAIRKYLETNKGNRILKLRLISTEDSIDIESRYYKFVKLLPPDWKYDPTIVRTLEV